MYKDKDKQREANRQAKARQRAKGMTQNVTERMYKANAQGMTKGMTQPEPVIPEQLPNVIPDKTHTEKCRKLLKDKGYPRWPVGELTKDRQLSSKGFNG